MFAIAGRAYRARLASFVLGASIALSLSALARAAHADPAPPFIVQFTSTLSSPSGIASDAVGNVYVVDTGNNRVLKFSNTGTLLLSWGAAGSGNSQFNQPWGIALDANNVYVTDSGNNRVQKFNAIGGFFTAWTVAGAHGIATDASGNIIVSETSAIGKFTNTGGLLTSWGTAGAGNGQFNTPLGVAADAAGNVYVADTNNGRIQKFTGAGAYVAQWGGLVTPDGIAVDNGGHVLVAETGGHRIDAFTNAGTLISQWGTQGSGNFAFQLPRALTTNASGNVLVLDTGNQALKAYGTVTTTALVSSANPSVYGQPVSLTATVAPTTVAASVTFKDAGVFMASAGTASGVAVLNPALSVGSHPLTGSYLGDASSAPSTSAIVAQQVNAAASTTTLTSSNNPSGLTQWVVFAATVAAVAPGAGTPSGNVTFLVDGSPITVALVTGAARCSTGSLTTGDHAVSASYAGDANFTGSNSSALTQTLVAAESPLPFEFAWGTDGTGQGQLLGAFAVAVNASGMVYTAEASGNRVQKFDPYGNFILMWGSAGSGNSQFNNVRGMAVDAAGNVYIADAGNSRIQKFTGDGVYVTQWGSAGTANGQFSGPSSVAVDGAGNVYVTETVGNRVQKFTSSGTFLAKWGTPGSGNGQFNGPLAIAVGANGIVYVGDYINRRIQEFTTSGVYVSQWGGLESPYGTFGILRGVTVDKDGNVWVAESGGYGNIQKYTSTGAFLARSGGDGTLANLGQLAVDNAGNVYVANAGYGNIAKFAHLERITAITDIKNDQGRQVRLRIAATGADTVGSATVITGYEVYRQVSAAGQPRLGARRPGISPAATQREGWDYVMTVPARGDTSYFAVVPTLADSNASGTNLSSFFVSATTASPTIYFYSPAASGYSVDNLPPALPAPFTAAYSGGVTALHWGRNSEPDFAFYKVYRGSSAAFVPSAGNLIATRSDTGYADPGAAGSWYKLSAVDVNGNESAFAAVSPGGTVSVGADAPVRFALESPWPNPSRGERLLVSFALPVAAPARLELIDVGGRLVASRDAGALGAGRHALELGTGDRLPPGLYLVRLTQGAMSRTTRAVVLD